MTKIFFRADTDIGFVYRDESGERPSSLSYELEVYAASRGYEFQRISSQEEKDLRAAKPGYPAEYALCRVLERDNHKQLETAGIKYMLHDGVWTPEQMADLWARMVTSMGSTLRKS